MPCANPLRIVHARKRISGRLLKLEFTEAEGRKEETYLSLKSREGAVSSDNAEDGASEEKP